VKVWVAEHGEYEQRGVWGVYASAEAAVAAIKAKFADPPYRVSWDQYETEVEVTLTGVFELVPDHSTSHTSTWEISPWDVVE
jgi:hypothetical protein